MSAESVRAFLASAAPDLEIVDLPASSQTHTLSAAWGIRAAQIAKTLALSVGGRAVLAVVCGDSRLDKKKVKAVLGGKATMLAPEDRDDHRTRARGCVPVWPRHAHADLL